MNTNNTPELAQRLYALLNGKMTDEECGGFIAAWGDELMQLVSAKLREADALTASPQVHGVEAALRAALTRLLDAYDDSASEFEAADAAQQARDALAATPQRAPSEEIPIWTEHSPGLCRANFGEGKRRRVIRINDVQSGAMFEYFEDAPPRFVLSYVTFEDGKPVYCRVAIAELPKLIQEWLARTPH